MPKLILTPEHGDRLELELYGKKPQYSIETILGSKNQVFNDRRYSIDVEGLEQGVTVTTLSIEGKDYVCRYDHAGQLHFAENIYENSDSVLFRDMMGIVGLEILGMAPNGEALHYFSNYLTILVPENASFRDVDAMLDCIRANRAEFLYRPAAAAGIGQDRPLESRQDLATRIHLVQGIADLYEANYPFFIVNSRCRLEQVKQVDRTDKLQYVDASTLQYIVQNPEYLRQAASGIRYGYQYYLPDKVMMVQNRITFDTYENRVIVSFLYKLLQDVSDLQRRAHELHGWIRPSPGRQEGYIDSSYFLLQDVRSKISEYSDILDRSQERLQELFFVYSRILPVTLIDMASMPSPTATMTSVPQYHMLFEAMIQWYRQAGYSFEQEEIMMNFFNIPTIYEAYVLVKLIRSAQAEGFRLTAAEKKKYRYSTRFSIDTESNNTFRFTGEEGEEVSIFYQPVLADGRQPLDPELPIIRNNSLSFNGVESSLDSEAVYSPDYIIKWQREGRTKYLILDAKYRRLHDVRVQAVPELAYKYLLSLSPAAPNQTVEGLYLLYGKTEGNQAYQSYYNLTGGLVRPKPEIGIIPLSEQVSGQAQEESLREMWRGLKDRT